MAKKEKNYDEVRCSVDRPWGRLTDEDMAFNNFYGARTIYERGFLSYLGNRITSKGCESDLNKMVNFLTKKEKAIAKFVKEHGTNSYDVFTAESPEGISLTATPNGSFGYVYVKMTWDGVDKRKAK